VHTLPCHTYDHVLRPKLKYELNAIVLALINADDACNMGFHEGDTKEHLNEVAHHYPDGKHAFPQTRFNKNDLRAALTKDGMQVRAHIRTYHNTAQPLSLYNML
jgi:hypothetical protein